MDLQKYGKLLSALRKEKGLTQKEVADKLGILSKTVSKWETGHGFPDVSSLTALAEILGVSLETLLSGTLNQNTEDGGNMKRVKFYVCPNCNNIVQTTAKCQIVCCGKQLEELHPANSSHELSISEVDAEYYITLPHEMTKEHYISFIAYVSYDRVMMVKLYPQQDCAARFPKLYGGKFVYYCSRDGLFEYTPDRKR